MCLNIFPEHYKQGSDLAIPFLLFCMGLFVFCRYEIHIKSKWLQKVIRFLAKHSFLIYLIHADIINEITDVYVQGGRPSVHFVKAILFTLVLSVIVAYVLNRVILAPLQGILMKKILLKKENRGD